MRIRDAEGASNYREGQLDVRKRAPKNKDVVLVGGCWLGASWLAGVKGPAAGVGSSSLELSGAESFGHPKKLTLLDFAKN